MLTIEAARRVTKTEENCDDLPRITRVLSNMFQLDLDCNGRWYDWDENNTERKRLKGYWIDRWNCTDTHVGEMAYFLDDELVFTGEQTARKSDASIYFVDQAAYEKVKVFMDYFRIPDELEAPTFIGDQQSRDVIQHAYADSVLQRVAEYQGRTVEIGHIPYNIRRDLNLPGSDGNCFYSLFPFLYVIENDVKTPVHVSELTFGLHIDGK